MSDPGGGIVPPYIAERIAIAALGDQVQAALEAAELPMAAFVLFGQSGIIEYRERIGIPALKKALIEAAEKL